MIPFDATVTVVVTISLLLLASILIQHECMPFLFGFDNVLELSSLYLLLLSYITGLVTVIADDISLVLELFLIIPHVCLVSVMAVIIFLDIFRSDSDDDWKRLSALPLTMRRSVAAFFSLHK